MPRLSQTVVAEILTRRGPRVDESLNHYHGSGMDSKSPGGGTVGRAKTPTVEQNVAVLQVTVPEAEANAARATDEVSEGSEPQSRDRSESMLEEVVIAPRELKALLAEIERLEGQVTQGNSKIRQLGSVIEKLNNDTASTLLDRLEQKLIARAEEGPGDMPHKEPQFGAVMQPLHRRRRSTELSHVDREGLEVCLAEQKETAARSLADSQARDEEYAANLKQLLEQTATQMKNLEARLLEQKDVVAAERQVAVDAAAAQAARARRDIELRLEAALAANTSLKHELAERQEFACAVNEQMQPGDSPVFWLQQQLIQEHKEKLELQRKLDRADRMISSLSETQF